MSDRSFLSTPVLEPIRRWHGCVWRRAGVWEDGRLPNALPPDPPVWLAPDPSASRRVGHLLLSHSRSLDTPNALLVRALSRQGGAVRPPFARPGGYALQPDGVMSDAGRDCRQRRRRVGGG